MSGLESSIWRRAMEEALGRGTGFDHRALCTKWKSFKNETCSAEPLKNDEQVRHIRDIYKEDA